MQHLGKKEQELIIKLSVEAMSANQISLIKKISSLLTAVVSADEEADFFDTSSELFKKVSELVKHSQFPEANRKINYGEQAVEYSIDNLNDTLSGQSLNTIDN